VTNKKSISTTESNSIYSTRKNCRLCGGEDLKLVVPLGMSPVSEKYVSRSNLSEVTLKVPLDLYFCMSCFHVQLLDVVMPEYLWSDFTFQTSHNPVLVRHFQDYVERIIALKTLRPTDRIIDVGSNDGTLLKCFMERGFHAVLGVDPASEIVARANNEGIRTIEGYMNLELVDKLVGKEGKATIVTANNVYAHVDDLAGMTRAIKHVLSEDGVFVFEVSYLRDVIEKNLIGTIFHEHLSYHSVTSLLPFLAAQGFELIHVERGPEQGGSIVGYAQHTGGPLETQASVATLLMDEKVHGLHDHSTVSAMYQRLERLKMNVVQQVEEFRSRGKTIAGFGAARAGTTLLSFFEIGDQLSFLFDDNESKHNRFSPGDKIEVLPTSSIYVKRPDCLMILAWIHADKIIQAHQQYLNEGGAFLRLFPKVELIHKN